MAIRTLILGQSGSGKTASLRNFDPAEVLVINCAGKPLPFRNHFECITPSFNKLSSDVIKAMDATDKKVIVIDDAQYIMSFQYMRRIKENGWEKWNDIQGDFFNIMQHCDELPADTTVYFLSHIQRDEEGYEKIKTMGKMLDEKITLEGLFTVVLKTSLVDGDYSFLTQNSGKDTVKSPIGMFETFAIDNDLKYVDTKIRSFYEIGNYIPDTSAMDQEAAKPEVEKPSNERKRRSRISEDPVSAEKKPIEPKAIPEESVIDIAEAAAKQDEPVQRRRKVRNDKDQEEVNKETPAEEKKAEAVAEPAETTAVNSVRNDAPKRRRRQREVEPADDSSVQQLNSNDYDLPFEV